MLPISISYYGTLGVGNDSAVFQAAIDANDGNGQAIALDAPLNLNSNVYLGDTIIQFNGWPINCNIDTSFTQTGTASLKSAAVILTKSAPGAGYSKPTVSIAFLDRAVFVTEKSDDSKTNTTGVLLVNVSQLIGTQLIACASGTGHSEVDPLDLYSAVQNVHLDLLRIEMANQDPVTNAINAGGCWIRNFDTVHPTTNINITKVELAGATRDEMLSIFSSTPANTTDYSMDVNNVHIGEVTATVDGGSGLILSIFRNNASYDSSKMRNISIGRITGVINNLNYGDADTPQILKFDQSAPRIGAIDIRFAADFPSSGVTGFIGVRGPTAGLQTELPYIERLQFEIACEQTVSLTRADVVYGTVDIGYIEISGSGTGWIYGMRFVRNIADCRITNAGLSYVVDGAESLNGFVDGRMLNVYRFRGTHIVNCDRYNASVWFTVSSTPTNWRGAQPAEISYEGDIQIKGTSPSSISRLLILQANPSSSGVPIPAYINYRASNTQALTITNNDTVSGTVFFPDNEYTAQITNGTVTAHRGVNVVLTPDTNGLIAPVFQRHIVQDTTVPAHNLSGVSGYYEGRRLFLRASSGTIVLIKHNSSAVGAAKIYSPTGADVIMHDIGYVSLTYVSIASRWEIDWPPVSPWPPT